MLVDACSVSNLARAAYLPPGCSAGTPISFLPFCSVSALFSFMDVLCFICLQRSGMWCLEHINTKVCITCMPVRHQVVGLPDDRDLCNRFQMDPADMLCCILVQPVRDVTSCCVSQCILQIDETNHILLMLLRCMYRLPQQSCVSQQQKGWVS